MPVQVLSPMELKVLKRISPSRYVGLERCALKEIWAAARYPSLVTVSPAARLGSVTHKIFELANRGMIDSEESMMREWDLAIQETENEMRNTLSEQHLVPLSEYAYNYEVKKNMTFAFARHLFGSHKRPLTQSSDRNIGPEVWVETPDGFVGGRIDLVKESGGELEIIDYKTGTVYDAAVSEHTLKYEYEIQLKLYAAMYHEAFGVWATKLTLIGLDQIRHNIDFNHDECLQLLNKAKKRLRDVNSLIEAGNAPEYFAAPSPEACFYCVYRPACPKYWETRTTQPQWPLDVMGQVSLKKILGNGSVRLVLVSGEDTISIRGLSSARHTFLSENANKVMLCNLNEDTVAQHYVAGLLTIGYSLV